MTPHPTLRLALCLALLGSVGLAGGCELPAALATLGGERIKAVHRLQPRPTAVVVDDPDLALGDPALAHVVASHVTHHLERNDALAGRSDNGKARGSLIPQRELAALASRLGDEYERMPIDQLGRMLDAEQVIHISIRSARLYAAPEMYRPTATVEVRVIDARQGRRLFPKPSALPSPDDPGFILQDQMRYRSSAGTGRGQDAMAARALAKQLGETVAKLFYDHKKPEPGHTLDG